MVHNVVEKCNFLRRNNKWKPTFQEYQVSVSITHVKNAYSLYILYMVFPKSGNVGDHRGAVTVLGWWGVLALSRHT